MKIIVNIKIKSTRRSVAPYELSFASFSELLKSLKEKLEDMGFYNVEANRIHVIAGTPISSDNYIDFIVDNTLSVLYDNVVAPYGAYEYDRVDGLIFFFHTAENCHKKYPHIHVRYSGEEISIYLLKNKIIGSLSNKKMLKRAVEYVNEHFDELIFEWNKIVG